MSVFGTPSVALSLSPREGGGSEGRENAEVETRQRGREERA